MRGGFKCRNFGCEARNFLYKNERGSTSPRRTLTNRPPPDQANRFSRCNLTLRFTGRRIGGTTRVAGIGHVQPAHNGAGQMPDRSSKEIQAFSHDRVRRQIRVAEHLTGSENACQKTLARLAARRARRRIVTKSELTKLHQFRRVGTCLYSSSNIPAGPHVVHGCGSQRTAVRARDLSRFAP